MGTKQATGGDVENPAAIADAEQHARQDIASRGARLAARLSRGAAPLTAGAGALLSAWLILRRRRRH